LKTIKPQKLGLLTRCYEFRQRCYMGVSVFAFIPLASEPALFSEVDMWKFAASELGKDCALDAGIPKARAEFLVTGSAYMPGGEPRGGCLVKAGLAGREKLLHVYGDRYWKGDFPSEPKPFESMPLDWAHAFGGEGFGQNPLGKGYGPVAAGTSTVQWLPNILYPDHRMTSPDQRPEPASFGPIDFSWPQRFSKAGTYDDLWLKEDFPGFARDVDWTIFNTAPPDQWFQGPLAGDEPYRLENLHPSRAVIEGRLPGLTACCFVNRRRDEAEIFEQIPHVLTTVWFFPHRERAILVFQGATEVMEDDASDILHMVVAAEETSLPKGIGYYRDLLAERLDKEKGHLLALRDGDLLPAGPALGGLPAPDESLPSPEGLLKKNLRRKAEQQIEESRAMVAGFGLDPDQHGPPVLPPENPLPDLDNLHSYIEGLKVEAEKRKEEAKAANAERDKEMEKILAGLGMDFDLIRAERETPHQGPPILPGEKDRKTLTDLAERFRELGLPTNEMDGLIADPDRDKLRASGDEAARGFYLKAAHHQAPSPPMSDDETKLARQAVLEARAAGRSLKGVNLTGVDLSGMDLSGIDFEEALLEGVNLKNASLRGANLKKAVLAHASLEGAVLTETLAGGANLGGARLCDAVVHGADLGNAILSKADLSGADFSGSLLAGADLSGTLFKETSFSRVDASRAVFLESDLKGLNLSGAQLAMCAFLKVNIAGTDFSGACLESAVFMSVMGDGAVLKGARMTNVRFVERCAFPSADFSGARMDRANLRGSLLMGSDFSGTVLDGADLSECDLTGARLYRATALDARFVKADLRDAVLTSLNAMNGIFQRADIRGADLRGANLFQADLARVRADGRTNLSDALTKKVRIYPKRRT
jgi:uncharacterized protein YjbI with pentapeptide repeats